MFAIHRLAGRTRMRRCWTCKFYMYVNAPLESLPFRKCWLRCHNPRSIVARTPRAVLCPFHCSNTLSLYRTICDHPWHPIYLHTSRDDCSTRQPFSKHSNLLTTIDHANDYRQLQSCSSSLLQILLRWKKVDEFFLKPSTSYCP